MSSINTNGIDANYPIPGKNNPTQPFRDNFSSIKNNLNIAGDEITDLQTKVVVKSALANTTINNDMANTLISNASIRSFRATTYNLGSSLNGTVIIDVSLGDVQYGTVSGNVTLQFGGWGPSGTQSNVQLQLNFSNTDAYISFPSQVVSTNDNYGVTTLEGFSFNGSVATVKCPSNVTQLDYRLSTIDCGQSIYIEPYNRPRQSTQIIKRDPTPVGLPGDTTGDICVGNSIEPLTITETIEIPDNILITTDTSTLYIDMPVMFNGVVFGNISSSVVYYIAEIVSLTEFKIKSTINGSVLALTNGTGTMLMIPVNYLYICAQPYDGSVVSTYATATASSGNTISINNTTLLQVNSPVMFSGNVFGGLQANTVYYIKSNPGGGVITISRSRESGIAGSTLELSNGSGNCLVTSYNGTPIWRKIQLNPW
jgi:hypothetical protein